MFNADLSGQPRARNMLARLVHAMIMISPINAAQKPATTALRFRGSGTMVPASNRGHTRLPLPVAAGADGSLLVKTTRDRVESGFRRSRGDSRRQTQRGQEFPGIASMQHVVGEFRRKCRWNCDRNEKLRGSDGNDAIEIRRSDSDNGRHLSVQAKRLSHRTGRGVETIAPETIADRHNGRIAALVQSGAQHTAALRRDTKHGRIVGRYRYLSRSIRQITRVPRRVQRELSAERRMG